MAVKKMNGAGRKSGALLYIKKDGKKGRGVYASRAIKQGAVVEECEIIFIPKKDLPYLKKTQVDSYYYCWKAAAALPLGFGVLYNHSFRPNAEWKDDYKNRRMTLFARREIKKDEEVTVNYNGNPKDQSRSLIWFPVSEDKKNEKN